MTEKMNIKKIIYSIIVLIASIAIIYHIGPGDTIVTKDVTHIVEDIPGFTAYDCTSDKKLVQTFVPAYNKVENINLLLLNISDESEGQFCYEIADAEKKAVYTGRANLSDIEVGEWSFDRVARKLKAGDTYYISFWSEDAPVAPQMLLTNSVFNLEENGTAYDGEQELDGAFLVGYTYDQPLSLYLRIFYVILFIFIMILLLSFIWIDDCKGKMVALMIKDNDLKKAVYVAGIVLVSVIALFIHLYRLTDVPYGFHIDEMGMGYDAWCIANFGVDRFLTKFPVYFTNFGTGQNALYTYLCAVCVKILGYSRLTLRIPAVFNAFLAAFFGLKLVDAKWHKRSINLMYLSLFTVLPVFLQATRFGLESYLMLGFAALFLYTLVYAVNHPGIRFFILSGICGGILLYTYAISYLVMIVFLAFTLVYLFRIHKVTWKNILAFILPLAIVGMPLVLVQIINMFDLPEMYIGPLTITKLQGYRGSEITLAHPLRTFAVSLKSIFLNDWINYNSFETYKTMYWISLPFLTIGVCNSLAVMVRDWKEKRFNSSTLMMIWFMAMLMMGFLLGGNGPNTNKLNGIFIACIFFLVEGIVSFYTALKGISWAKIILTASAVTYLISFAHFTNYYFNEYKDDVYPDMLFEAGYEDALAYMNEQLSPEQLEKTVYISETDAIFFLGTVLPSPYDYEYNADMGSFGNYRFYLPDEIDYQANYLVWDTETDYAIQLEEAGYQIEKIGSWFVCTM